MSGIDNFGFISEEVWRGGPPTPQGVRTLAAMHARTIIDLREEREKCFDEGALACKEGMKYVPIPTHDWWSVGVNRISVLKAIQENEKPVFIHCRQGRDRTGMAVAAYRLSRGMHPKSAIEELKHFCVNPWWQWGIEIRINYIASHANIGTGEGH